MGIKLKPHTYLTLPPAAGATALGGIWIGLGPNVLRVAPNARQGTVVLGRDGRQLPRQGRSSRQDSARRSHGWFLLQGVLLEF
jgi:hypothetical protein